MEVENEPDGQLRRIVVLFAAAMVLVALIAGLIIWSPWSTNDSKKSDSPVVSDFTLSADDSRIIQRRADSILSATGNFGIDDSQLTNNNIQEIGYVVSRQDEGWDSYTTSRAASYDSIRSSIMRGSPVDYDRKTTAEWEYGDELDRLKSFNLNESDAKVPEKGTIESSDGEDDAHYVRVNVTFNSTVTERLVTAEDVSWDGSYRILQKDFSGSATLVFRDYAGEWLLYGVEKPQNEFLLSLWSPNFTDEYTNKMYDFRETEIITPDEPYTPGTEGK